MYNFAQQKAMLNATLLLLEENDLLNVSSLGGGTALAAYYWNHRYSTDIDIFIYNTNTKHLLKESNWSHKVKKAMESIGYEGNIKNHPIYTEIMIDKECKIQFFEVIKKSETPYQKVNLWGNELFIDTIEEIIAKKIYYRASKGNSRDLFDITIAFHKEPDILMKMKLTQNNIIELFETITHIYHNQELKSIYLEEIKQMNPNNEYMFLATNAIAYLYYFLESICGAYDIGYELKSEEYIEIEKYVFEQLK